MIAKKWTLGLVERTVGRKRRKLVEELDEFEINRLKTSSNDKIIKLNVLLLEIRDFMSDFQFLVFGRDFTLLKNTVPITGNRILDSASRTIESMRNCCLNANFADAYTLLRKYRDDIFFYVYILAGEKSLDNMQREQKNKFEDNICDWINNQLNNLYVSDVFKIIFKVKDVQKTIKKYNLQNAMSKMNDRLNNYVHSNGRSYYNCSFDIMDMNGEIGNKCNEFTEAITFITMTFLVIIIMVNPILIMSSDYVDCLEVNYEEFKNVVIPIEGKQYLVPPFVSEFIVKHKGVLDEKVDEYIRNMTGMQV